MPAGKTIAPGGPQHTCQLTGWAAPDLTAISTDEFPSRAAAPTALLIRASMVMCYLADPRPPPPFSHKTHHAFRMAPGPARLGVQRTRNRYREAYRQRFILPARIDAGGFFIIKCQRCRPGAHA